MGYEWLARRVLVTGASSGIGRETALILAAKGAQVCLLARNRPRLDRLDLQIVAEGG
jgi:short-subunit dehydrogenase